MSWYGRGTHDIYVTKKTRASRATHYTSENITDDGTHTNWVASRPGGTCEAYDDAWDKGEACKESKASGPGRWGRAGTMTSRRLL